MTSRSVEVMQDMQEAREFTIYKGVMQDTKELEEMQDINEDCHLCSLEGIQDYAVRA